MQQKSSQENNNYNPELRKELGQYLDKHPEAVKFIGAYGMLCHVVDDLIDKDTTEFKNKGYALMMLDAMSLAVDVYSSNFYQQNISWLYPIIKNIHRVFGDSVAWEDDKEKWKAEYADKLRCCGNEIVVAILEHVCNLPYEKLREISLKIREDSFKRHHTETGEPV